MIRWKPLRSVVARWGRVVHGVTLGVRVLVRDDKGRVLLVRHGYAPGWHLPGGAVDLGETAERAAARELLEETGVIAVSRPKLAGLYFNPAFGGRDHVALFIVDTIERGPEPKLGVEIAERGWFSADALPQDTTPATLRRFAEIAGDVPPSDRW